MIVFSRYQLTLECSVVVRSDGAAVGMTNSYNTGGRTDGLAGIQIFYNKLSVNIIIQPAVILIIKYQY